MKIKNVKAHCDIPCAVYDPAVAQYAALSVLRFLDLIGEMPENINSKKDFKKQKGIQTIRTNRKYYWKKNETKKEQVNNGLKKIKA